ncbi:MAG: hypothetical protein KU37_05850 [Sulfuricurvum sp. PC08-66]|nr:MAG: hypothetical protein KU37_05850 [Sulfuricurvum sp. PC08-66]
MRWLVMVLLLTHLGWAQKLYEACETTPKEALAALANQIISNVSSEFSLDESTQTGGIFGPNASKSAKRSISSQSRLTLTDVTYVQANGMVCAQISQEQLLEIARGKLKNIKHASLDKLPTDEIAAVNMLEEHLADLRQIKATATLLPNAFNDADLALVNQQLQLFSNERANRFTQKISFLLTPDTNYTLTVDGVPQKRLFDVYLRTGKHAYTLEAPHMAPYSGEFELLGLQERTVSLDLSGNQLPKITFAIAKEAQLFVDGKPFNSNITTPIAVGSHTYRVEHPSYCPIEGDFALNLGANHTITIDVARYGFPQLTINSNQSNARLLIAGQEWSLGKTQTFDTCSHKDISYQITFAGTTKTGTVGLEAGMVRTLNVDFLTKVDEENLKAIAANYEKGGRWVVRAGADWPEPAMISYQLDLLDHSKWLRHGWGGLWGRGDTSWVADLHYTFAMQLSTFGNNNMPLHLENIAVLIPYFGVEAGLALRGGDMAGVMGVLKTVVGVDVAFTKYISVELFYHQNTISDRKNSVVGLALSLANPFK